LFPFSCCKAFFMQDLQIKLSGFGLVVEVIVSCEALEDKAVWLLVIPKVAVAKDVLLNDNQIQSSVFDEFCRVFRERRMKCQDFIAFWRAVRKEKDRFKCQIVTIKDDAVHVIRHSSADAAEREKVARKEGMREGAAAMARIVKQIRDDNVLLLTAAAKSENARYSVNKVYMREKADGSRTCINVHGVAVPKLFPPKSVATAAVESLIASELSMYRVDAIRQIQFAPIEAVLGKAIESADLSAIEDRAVEVILIDHLDAISATKSTKRSPCRLRVFSRDLFGDSLCSPSVVWFDYEGSVHRIVEFAEWRTSEYNRVINKIVRIDQKPIV
jgi:hypothetical protein